MDEISNKTIVILLIGAIIISLGGTIVSLNKISKIKTVSITGFAPGDRNQSAGNVSLTISDITWINFTVRSCNLGSGYVTQNKCELNSSRYANVSACSPSFSTSNVCDGLQVKNIGNNNVTLNITWKNNSQFIQGSGAELWFKTVNGTIAGANNGCKAGQQNFDRKWNQVARAGQHNLTCSRFYFGSSENTMSMHLRVRIQQGAASGHKQNIITAIGRAI
jgi:hypothetical protein